MKDLFDTIIVCKDCNQKTEKHIIKKEGFELRSWKCPKCKQTWIHPGDLKEFEEFQKIKHKDFQVKLRVVGNSYTVSIPREIIEFGEIKRDRIVKVCLDNPQRIMLSFSKVTKKFIKIK